MLILDMDRCQDKRILNLIPSLTHIQNSSRTQSQSSQTQSQRIPTQSQRILTLRQAHIRHSLTHCQAHLRHSLSHCQAIRHSNQTHCHNPTTQTQNRRTHCFRKPSSPKPRWLVAPCMCPQVLPMHLLQLQKWSSSGTHQPSVSTGPWRALEGVGRRRPTPPPWHSSSPPTSSSWSSLGPGLPPLLPPGDIYFP